MKVTLIKTAYNNLVCATDEDYEKLKRIKPNQEYVVNFKELRNYEFHKKFFALVNLGFQNTKSGITEFNDYRAYLIMKSGFYRLVKTNEGKFAIPKSISFEKMDNLEFEELFSAAISFVILDTGVSEQDLIENIAENTKKNILNFM